jgi:hypothetical protein
MDFKKIPYIIPKDWSEKKEIALKLEQYFIDFINKSGLDPIDAIIELCDREDVRIEDIEDYFPLMPSLIDMLKSKRQTQNAFKGLF